MLSSPPTTWRLSLDVDRCLAERRERYGPSAFTLIELLVVIGIISLLTSLVGLHILHGREKARRTFAEMTTSRLQTALAHYYRDEGRYPGTVWRGDPEDAPNDFPALFRALFGTRKPLGPGGRSAPYGGYRREDVVVWDEETSDFRTALRAELDEDAVDKYIRDPWGNPYLYRLELRENLIHLQASDAYAKPAIVSLGRDGTPDLSQGAEDGDDIGVR